MDRQFIVDSPQGGGIRGDYRPWTGAYPSLKQGGPTGSAVGILEYGKQPHSFPGLPPLHRLLYDPARLAPDTCASAPGTGCGVPSREPAESPMSQNLPGRQRAPLLPVHPAPHPGPPENLNWRGTRQTTVVIPSTILRSLRSRASLPRGPSRSCSRRPSPRAPGGPASLP